MDKINKRGSLTSRTLEKLGFSAFRFRSNSQPDDLEQSRTKAKGSSEQIKGLADPDKPSLPTVASGELEFSDELLNRFTLESLDSLANKSPKRNLRERLFGGRSGYEDGQKLNRKHKAKKDTVPTARFYVDDLDNNDMVTSKAGDKHEDPTTTSTMQEKKKKVQPEGTIEYKVQDSDTLEKIAAKLDTTPSELRKLNKLTTTMIFPGQTLFVPDKDYVWVKASTSPPPTSKEPSTSDTSTSRQADTRPQMDVPLIKSGNSSPTKVPGHAERQTPVSSPKDTLDFEVVPPHKLSEDEVQQLDQDCMERFIKLNVKHITDGQGVVRGVLLVTPNAVMFDPDVSDALVVERGADKYGMIAPMDLIISAAMYHDIAAMKLRGQKMDDGTAYPRPEVYHDKSCPLAKERLEQSQRLEQENLDPSLPKDLRRIKNKPLTKTDSVCSCGAGGLEADVNITGESVARSPGEVEDDVAVEFNKSRTDETIPEDILEVDSKTVDQDKDDVFREGTEDSAEFGDLPKVSANKGKKLTVSFSIPESGASPDAPVKADDKPSVSEADTATESTVTDSVRDAEKDKQQTVKETHKEDDQPCDVKDDSGDIDKAPEATEDEKTDDVDKSGVKEDTDSDDKTDGDSKDQKIKIGNIVYLSVTEDSDGQLNLKSFEESKNTLSKMSESEFGAISKSDTNLASNVEPREPEKPRSSSTSSLGPFSPTPHLNAFVNYATGFFQKHASENSIKDIKDMIIENAPKPSDLPVISAVPFGMGRRKGKLSRHSENKTQEVEVESAVTMDEKADLMTMDYDRFKPRQSTSYQDPPLYLCLKLGQPQNRQNVFHNYSIESYGRRRKKSEYWFSIPREKVDHLYAFFVQWTPEIYGDEEELTAERRGFVVIDDSQEDDLEMLDEHFGPNSSFQKDWEIISTSEALKRRSIVFDVPLPLPELIGESAILSEEHISELSPILPGRTVGYPWTLIYSTDKHGFSLKTLYRDMQGLDSPILLVVKDTYDNVFGALTSCELKVSESFYGTGETFLYTFYPDFQTYHWSGDNNFFIKGDQHSLCIGAGQGVNGLWLDEDLYHGRTNKCETFNNDILTASEDFVLKAFEAWAFIFD